MCRGLVVLCRVEADVARAGGLLAGVQVGACLREKCARITSKKSARFGHLSFEVTYVSINITFHTHRPHYHISSYAGGFQSFQLPHLTPNNARISMKFGVPYPVTASQPGAAGRPCVVLQPSAAPERMSLKAALPSE